MTTATKIYPGCCCGTVMMMMMMVFHIPMLSPSQQEMLIGGNLVRNFRRNDIQLLHTEKKNPFGNSLNPLSKPLPLAAGQREPEIQSENVLTAAIEIRFSRRLLLFLLLCDFCAKTLTPFRIILLFFFC